MDGRDLELIALAESQKGLVTRAQIGAVGLTRSAWRHRLDQGGWQRVTPRVARRAGSPATPEQAALAAVLDVGPAALLSHSSGAAVWGVPGFRLAPHHVIEVRDQAPHTTAVGTAHRPVYAPGEHAVVVDGLPVVRPELMLLQLAASVHPDRLARMVDGLWARRLVSGRSLHLRLDPLLQRGRSGSAAMRAVLDARPASYVPPASGLEGRTMAILAEVGIALRRQVALGDDEQWCGRVDFASDEVPLVLEVDGDRWHRALVDVAADEARRARLEMAGFVVVRADEHIVWHDRAGLVRLVRDGWWRAAARARAA